VDRILEEIWELRRDVAGVREEVAGLRGELKGAPDAQTFGGLRANVTRLNWFAGTVIGALIIATVALIFRGVNAGV